jgi:assimilatory nitrate reductase catalytic subunit
MPKGPGLKAVELFAAIDAGRVRAVWIMSTNPVVSMPEADAVRAALEACDFVVVSDCMASTDTTACADVLLPAAAWGEKSGTVTNSERRISRQRVFLEPPGEAQPDWWIVSEVAKRMGFAASFDYAGPAAIFREHAALSAFENDGSRDFDVGALAALSDNAYDALEPVRWPLCRRRVTAEPLSDGRFFTPTGKARFVPTIPAGPASSPGEERPFVMITGRIRDQWHTMTRTGKSARLSQTRPEPFVAVHSRDAIAADLANNGLAKITSAHGEMIGRVEWCDDLRRGEVFVPMHWTDELASAGRVGALIAAAADPHSGQPELKATPVAIEPLTVRWHAFALCREPVTISRGIYAVKSRGADYWRYELAGADDASGWPAFARDCFGADGDWIEFADPRSGSYRGARLVDGRLAACLFVSPTSRLPDRAWLGLLFRNEGLSDAERAGLLAGRAADGAADMGPVVCACHAVGRDALVRAMARGGVVSIAGIGELLGAGTNCGSCIPELNALIAAHAQVRPVA